MVKLSDLKRDSLLKEIPCATKEERQTSLQIEEDDEYTSVCILLFYLILILDYDTQKIWKEFADEIKYKSRFFPDSQILTKIEKISDVATIIIQEGDILYRAREYSISHFLESEVAKTITKELKNILPELNIEDDDIRSDAAMSIIQFHLLANREKSKSVLEKMRKILEEHAPFYGFDKKNSDAPPSCMAKEGRANAKGISYLYAAKDIKTAILEMRPQMEKSYNVCSVKVIKDAKIFDFTYAPTEIKDTEYSILLDLHRISEEFSKPNFGDPIEYLPTQFLCEYISKMGFDGIKYKSAVSAGGYNVLFFDTNAETRVYDVLDSKVYKVNSIDINISQALPITEYLCGEENMLI